MFAKGKETFDSNYLSLLSKQKSLIVNIFIWLNKQNMFDSENYCLMNKHEMFDIKYLNVYT